MYPLKHCIKDSMLPGGLASCSHSVSASLPEALYSIPEPQKLFMLNLQCVVDGNWADDWQCMVLL